MKVGVLDSGAGGLTILNAIHTKCPYLDLLYLADEAYAPYGNKSIAQLQDRMIKISRFFESENVSAIVVACNTATVAAIDVLRASTHLPVVGVEPAVKPACRLSKQRRVAVLATPVTAQSARLNELIDLWQADSHVTILSSDTLAYDIDEWPESEKKITLTIQDLAQKMQADSIDTLVLACTHYPLVKPLFESALGPNCEIIEPSAGVTAQLIRRLEESYPSQFKECLLSMEMGSIELCSTQGVEAMNRLILWINEKQRISSHRQAVI
ncbi:glutamate racemase [Marinomonas sp.]|nr:glutamate racemase [Marinomonas sp.]MDB4836913.1 glutamate racemase [Marinomonas sp.]